MKLEVFAEYIRGSVIGTDPQILYDKEFNPTMNSLTDIINMSLNRAANGKDLEYLDNEIPDDLLYPVTLHCKIELFSRLATKSAPLYSIKGSDVDVNKGERFAHYYQLINQLQNLLKEYQSSGGSYVVESYDSTIIGRYYSERNKRLYDLPKIKVDYNLNPYDIELSWKTTNIKVFGKYQVYYLEGNETIIDQYDENKINSKAIKVKEEYNYHNSKCRITGLEPNKEYTIAIVVQERNGLLGFEELTLKTPLDPNDMPIGLNTPNATLVEDTPNEGNGLGIYNKNDMEYTQEQLDKTIEELGVEICVTRTVENIDPVFGDSISNIEDTLFICKGLYEDNPDDKILTPYGAEHNANVIFNITTKQIEDYMKKTYNDNSHILWDTKHNLVTKNGNIAIKLSDYIQYQGLKYHIVNIVPHTTFVGKSLMYTFECSNNSTN